MAVLIDASILIEAERGRLDLKQHVAQRQEEEFFLSMITASELLHGVHRAVRSEVRTKRAAFVEAILERFPLLPVDLATARAHAQVWAELAAAGSMIGPHDLWLAATCIAHGLTIVTAKHPSTLQKQPSDKMLYAKQRTVAFDHVVSGVLDVSHCLHARSH